MRGDWNYANARNALQSAVSVYPTSVVAGAQASGAYKQSVRNPGTAGSGQSSAQ